MALALPNPFSGTWSAPWNSSPKPRAAAPVNTGGWGGMFNGTTQSQSTNGYAPARPTGNPALPFNPAVYSGPQDPSSNLANWGPKPSEVQTPLWKQLYNNAMGQAAPLFASFEDANAMYNKQMSDIEGGYGAAAGAAKKGGELQNRGVDLDFEQLANDRAALDRQTPYLDALFGIRSDQRKAEQGYLKGLDALGEKDLANNLAGADAENAINNRNQRSDAAVRGATSTSGNADRLSDISKAFGVKTTGFKLARERDALGIKHQWDDNYFAGLADAAKTDEDKKQIQDQYKTFDVLEKRYNLTREQIANSVAQTLANMNLNKITSVGQVLSGIQGNNQKSVQLNWEILSKAVTDAQALGATNG